MKHKKEQVMMKNMLSEAIMVLCKASLEYRSEFHIEGLIGITLDNEEIFLVNFNEHVNKEKDKSLRGESASTVNSDDNDRTVPSPIRVSDSPVPSPKSHKEWGPKSRRHLKRITPSSNDSSPVKQARVQSPPPPEPLVIKPIEDDSAFDSESPESAAVFPVTVNAHNNVQQLPPPAKGGDGDISYTSGSEHGDRSFDGFPPMASGNNTSADNSLDGISSSTTWIPPTVNEVAGENSHDESSLGLVVSEGVSLADFHHLRALTSAGNSVVRGATRAPRARRGGRGAAAGVNHSSPNLIHIAPKPTSPGPLNMTTRQGPNATSPRKPAASPSYKHPCTICGKLCQNRLMLTYHMYTHTGEKPFKCGVCDRAFTQKGNMQKHMNTHSGRKDFWCPICHQMFDQRNRCQDHVRNVHQQDPNIFFAEQYKCPPVHLPKVGKSDKTKDESSAHASDQAAEEGRNSGVEDQDDNSMDVLEGGDGESSDAMPPTKVNSDNEGAKSEGETSHANENDISDAPAESYARDEAGKSDSDVGDQNESIDQSARSDSELDSEKPPTVNDTESLFANSDAPVDFSKEKISESPPTEHSNGGQQL